MLIFDAIVVGAGTAGCLAAKTAAEAGLKVCLVERKGRDAIGEKVCGDALGEHHLTAVKLEKPQSGELERRIEGIKIYSPDMETIFTVRHEDFVGYMLNRRLFGQWLLKKAIDNDVALLDLTQCLGPIVENGFVVGVIVKNLRTGEKVEIRGKVVVDSSGYSAVIRRKLPEQMEIEREIENEDVEACYREIRQLKQESENADFCEIYLNQNVTPGGYAWIFPKAGAKINVGLGVCMRGKFPNPKKQLYEYVLTKKRFEGSQLLNGGAWYDPTRRPLDNMVGNGVIITGDAACLVNPIHGGGIGPSMISGYLSGKTIVEASEKGDFSRNSLWRYNYVYMKMYGAKQAWLDVFRFLLLASRDEDLSYGMKCRLLTEEDVLKAGLGKEFRLNIGETAKRVFRGIKRISFLNKLRITVEFMEKVKAHYKDYPETPEHFAEWRTKNERLFKKAKVKLVK